MQTKEHDTNISSDKVIITQMKPEFIANFATNKYFNSARRRGDVFLHGLPYHALRTIKLVPKATRLIALQTEEKSAVGFLYLEENTPWLYTIEYVFVEPNYRKMGLAIRLLDKALFIAKEKGARKVSLRVDHKSEKGINLYKKLGFEEVGRTFLVQRHLPGAQLKRFFKRYITGQGCLTRLTQGKNSQLHEINPKRIENREKLLAIHNKCISQEWKNFFEIDQSNFTLGSRYIWYPRFFRDIVINDSADSFAIVTSRPFSSQATVELYSTPDAATLSIIESLQKTLAHRGIIFSQITLFNQNENLPPVWLEERGLAQFQFVVMGKILEKDA